MSRFEECLSAIPYVLGATALGALVGLGSPPLGPIVGAGIAFVGIVILIGRDIWKGN